MKARSRTEEAGCTTVSRERHLLLSLVHAKSSNDLARILFVVWHVPLLVLISVVDSLPKFFVICSSVFWCCHATVTWWTWLLSQPFWSETNSYCINLRIPACFKCWYHSYSRVHSLAKSQTHLTQVVSLCRFRLTLVKPFGSPVSIVSIPSLLKRECYTFVSISVFSTSGCALLLSIPVRHLIAKIPRSRYYASGITCRLFSILIPSWRTTSLSNSNGWRHYFAQFTVGHVMCSIQWSASWFVRIVNRDRCRSRSKNRAAHTPAGHALCLVPYACWAFLEALTQFHTSFPGPLSSSSNMMRSTCQSHPLLSII